MERLSEVLNIVLASGLIGQFAFFKSKRRKQNAEADVTEFDALKMQIKHFSDQLKEAYIEIDHMQEIIDRERARHVELSKDLSDMRIKVVQEEERRAVAKYNECTVSNCPNRTPPRIIEDNETNCKENI